MKRKRMLADEAILVLRQKLKLNQQLLEQAQRRVRNHEFDMSAVEFARSAVFRGFEAVFHAVSILADRVKPKTVEDRAARMQARKLLEEAGIKPPSTLGSSRSRKPKKRRMRKKG
jgi:hypothetical protein